MSAPDAHLQGENPEFSLPHGAQFASLGRRLAALATDWVLCLAIAGIATPRVPGAKQFMPLFIFFCELVLLTALNQASAGQRILNISIIDSRTGGIPPLSAILLRSALICLVIPALLTVNGVGLHDRICHTRAIYRPGNSL
jgi:uncharacterized RDD family membrane protein YckC